MATPHSKLDYLVAEINTAGGGSVTGDDLIAVLLEQQDSIAVLARDLKALKDAPKACRKNS